MGERDVKQSIGNIISATGPPQSRSPKTLMRGGLFALIGEV